MIAFNKLVDAEDKKENQNDFKISQPNVQLVTILALREASLPRTSSQAEGTAQCKSRAAALCFR